DRGNCRLSPPRPQGRRDKAEGARQAAAPCGLRKRGRLLRAREGALTAIRKYATFREEILAEGGREADGSPLIRVAVAAVIANPSPGLFQEDVSANIPLSIEVGQALTMRALELLGGAEVASYGKGAIAGEDGDQEQCVSFLTTAFGDTLRHAVGGTEWVSSVTKRGGP